jgi:hypothetical protein
MPEIEIEGRRVEVDDSFTKLSPEQQQQTANEIARQLGISPQAAPTALTATPIEQPTGEKDFGEIEGLPGKSLFTGLGGLTLGFADELFGGAAAAKDLISQGISGIGGLFGADIPVPDRNPLQTYQQVRDAIREETSEFAEEAPGTALGLEIGGGLLTGGVGAARAGAFRGTQSLPRLAGVSATEGAIQGAGFSEAETLPELAEDIATGGVLGGTVGASLPSVGRLAKRGLERAAGDIGGAADQVYQSAVRTLEKSGLRLSTGQKTGNEAIKGVETTLGGSLFGGSIADQFKDQREKLNSKLFELSGFTSKDASEGVLSQEAINRASNRFGQRYDTALKGKTVKLDTDDFVDDLAGIEARHQELLGVEQRKQVTDIVNQLFDRAVGKDLSGKDYQRLRSFLGKRQRQTFTSNGPISDLYGDLKLSLDNAFERSTGDNLKALNSEYANFKSIETIFDRTAAGKRGDLPLASLVNLAQRSPGTKEFKDLTLAANQVLRGNVPDSGTATRALNLAPFGAFLADPTAGAASGIAPFLASQGLSRGVGSGLLRGGQQLAQGGANVARGFEDLATPLSLLAAPAAVPLLAQ